MLFSTEELRGLQLVARDGEVGSVRDVYFDDDRWTVRYLVVRTGNWLSGRNVLISPHAVERLDREHQQVHLALTRKQIERAPSIDTDRPVSRQQEESYHDHFGYPYYWVGPHLWGSQLLPAAAAAGAVRPPDEPAAGSPAGREASERKDGDRHLRSSAEVTGYTLRATDDTIGHVEDFLFDDRQWTIDHVVVDTTNWWPGGQVLLPRTTLERIDWSAREAVASITRQAVKDAPPYVHDPLGREASVRDVQRHFEGSV